MNLVANGANRLKAGYGASEFGGGIVINSDKELFKTDSAGRILPGAIGMVIDPETNEELPYDQNGELCFHSPTMMLGYLNCEEETKQITLYKNGIKYYRTGDKGSERISLNRGDVFFLCSIFSVCDVLIVLRFRAGGRAQPIYTLSISLGRSSIISCS